MNRYFIEVKQRGNKNMKKSSTALVMKETQIKNPQQYEQVTLIISTRL